MQISLVDALKGCEDQTDGVIYANDLNTKMIYELDLHEEYPEITEKFGKPAFGYSKVIVNELIESEPNIFIVYTDNGLDELELPLDDVWWCEAFDDESEALVQAGVMLERYKREFED